VALEVHFLERRAVRLRNTLLAVVAAVVPPGCAGPLPNGTALEEVNFERHVASLLGRLGCNTGACHGSFQVRAACV